MKKVLLAVLAMLVVSPTFIQAQETYFGKNKVRYRDFDWSYIQTRRFDIYFYEDSYELAKFSAAVLESSYVEVSRELNYLIQDRIPVFLYNSPNDFQQTNITSSLLPEGVGGFTEIFKNRMVLPFNGSYEDFRHVLHHELTHAVTFDLLYGNNLSSLISRNRLFQIPLWYAEGYAEYSSRHGWDYHSDMFMRDAAINGYLQPIGYIGGYMAYRQGQAMVKYLADTYGEEKLGMVLRKGKIHLSMNKALKETYGITEKELWEEFSKEMKRRYWPDIATRQEADEFADQLTKAREDGSYYNEKPVYTPDGDKVAIFTDESDFTEIVLIDAVTGEITDRLVTSSRTGGLESLHSYVSGVSFSPDGRQMVFVAKSHGRDALFLYDMTEREVAEVKRYEFNSIVNPDWSPDGERIVFSALEGDRRDLWVYEVSTDTVTRIMADRHDDTEPSWMADSKSIVFSSDRYHPQNPAVPQAGTMYSGPEAYMPGDFTYGSYNLHTVDIETGIITPLDVGFGANMSPKVSPDGTKLAFISNRNGIDNIYVAYLDKDKVYAVTDILSGVRSISWSPDGDKIAFSAFFRGSFDIFTLDELVPAGDDGVLTLTDFAMGKYNLLREAELAKKGVPEPLEDPLDVASPIDEYVVYEVDPEEFAELMDSTQADTDTTVLDTLDAKTDTTETTDTLTAEDSVITETGIHDGEFVYISEEELQPLDSMFVDVSDDVQGSFGARGQEEPEQFDSIPGPRDGEFEVKEYETKFTPDFAGGGFAYDTFFGLRGQSVFVFSDYLGNHQFIFATDLVNTIDQANVQAFYFYNRHRTNFGVGLFHTKNYYEDSFDHLFSDRFYGLQFYASRPFSTFSRLELTAGQYFIDRQFYDFDDPRDNRNTAALNAEFAYVTDNILWGITGPINGRRSKLALSGGGSVFGDNDRVNYYAIDLDYRRYWHFAERFSLAFRLAGGASFGGTPKRYFLGGTTNWIGNRTVDAEVYEEENLYFADVITPLRGHDYYEYSGNRYALMNLEFRYPMIEYFLMRFPIPIAISRVTGALFWDFGAAWDDGNFKGGSSEGGGHLQDIKSGFGFGMRANLGFLLLRYDLAWSTDYQDVSDKPTSYFSLGADF
jgi:Tol biopolymer transport system component